MMLGRDVARMPRVRKTHEMPPRIAIYDVIAAITGARLNNAPRDFARLREQYGDVLPKWKDVAFADALGRKNKETPVTDAPGIINIIFLRSYKSCRSPCICRFDHL